MASVPPYSNVPTGELIQLLINKGFHGSKHIVDELNQRFILIDHERKMQVNHDLNEYEKAKAGKRN